LWLIAISCRNGKNEPLNAARKVVRSDSSGYPQSVKSAGSIKQYDAAKWSLYCMLAQDTCRFMPVTGISAVISFGELNLKFKDLRRCGDSTEYYFDFFYKDTIKCDFKLIGNFSYFRGIGFIGKSDSIAYWISPTTVRYWTGKGATNKLEHPLQPDVIAYIRRNQDKLNPWFLAEARKRKVIP